MKNVHLLQTETYPAKLQLDRDYGTLTILDEPCVINGQDFVGANLYITSDEEIKEGDWVFDLDVKRIVKADSLKVATSKKSQCWYYKKIILTTDPRLIKDGVQALDDEFLEWFIKNQKREIPIITTTVNNESRYTTNIGFESWRKETPEQERSYSEEDLRECWKAAFEESFNKWVKGKPKTTFKKWLNQFKKSSNENK